MGKTLKAESKDAQQQRADFGSGGETSQDAGNSTADCRERCGHYSRDVPHLDKLLWEIVSSKHLAAAACEHCPKASASGAEDTSDTWVCLDCGRRFCGGLVWDAVPYGHARRHARKHRHSWLARYDQPSLVYCVSCQNEVPIEMPVAEPQAAAKP